MVNGGGNLSSFTREELEAVVRRFVTKDELDSLDPQIPLSIFSTDLPPLNALARYLVDERGFPLTTAAKILARSPATLSIALRNARSTLSQPMDRKPSLFFLPVSTFADRRKSVQEHVVAHLKSSGLTFAEIGRFLKRDQRTIYTTFRRGVGKDA